MNTCALFDERLTTLLAEGSADPRRRELLAQLQRHATGCTTCAASLDLIELAALPIGQRDPGVEPPAGYWEAFNTRVGSRVERAESRRSAPSWRLYAAAAVIVVALVTGWLSRGWFATAPDAISAVSAATSQSNSLEEALRQATPEELAEALRGLPGGAWAYAETAESLDDGGLSGSWIPDTEELDELDQSTLNEWLEQLAPAEGRPTS